MRTHIYLTIEATIKRRALPDSVRHNPPSCWSADLCEQSLVPFRSAITLHCMSKSKIIVIFIEVIRREGSSLPTTFPKLRRNWGVLNSKKETESVNTPSCKTSQYDMTHLFLTESQMHFSSCHLQGEQMKMLVVLLSLQGLLYSARKEEERSLSNCFVAA